MELIAWALFSAPLILVVFFGRLMSSFLTDELKAWTPSIIAHLIKTAVLRLPEEKRERFAEEWSSHVNEVPGNLSKLYVAFGFLRASWKMSPDPALDLPFVFIKRSIDLFLGGAVLASIAPFFLVIAALIKMGSNGPIFVSELRWGYQNRPIRLIRFRIYRTDSEELVPLGIWLARTSLDLLPELLNVVRGDLSLVGPRPRRIRVDDTQSPIQSMAKPGITGWAQLNVTRNTTIQESIACDDWYIENRSIYLDLKILLWTLTRGLFPNHHKNNPD